MNVSEMKLIHTMILCKHVRDMNVLLLILLALMSIVEWGSCKRINNVYVKVKSSIVSHEKFSKQSYKQIVWRRMILLKCND